VARSDLLRRLISLEADVMYQVLANDEEAEFSYVTGQVPVLLSAPHGSVHMRLGELKPEDEYTSGFARLIAEITSAHVIYARRKSQTDPNWYPDIPYKHLLQKIVEAEKIRFVLDIHGASEQRTFGIALGTMRGKSCPQQRGVIISQLESQGFNRRAEEPLRRLDVDRTFSAAGQVGQETITRFVSDGLGIPAAQIELHPCLRIVERRADATESQPFYGEPERIEATVRALNSVVLTLVESIVGRGL
jgi:hypothetical protein